jgi:hypothetical protein
MLGITNDGHKLPASIISGVGGVGVGKNLPKDKFVPGIILRGQERGWMTKNLLIKWLNVL